MRIGILKVKFKNGVLEIKSGRNWEFKKIVWELEFWKLNLGIGILGIKFESN